jgi:hypothetical protein
LAMETTMTRNNSCGNTWYGLSAFLTADDVIQRQQ